MRINQARSETKSPSFAEPKSKFLSVVSVTLEINPFVSFRVLFQCKRYAKGNLVSRAQVGDFRNTMIGRAEKGIIITTSGFSNAAVQEANREGAPQVELVDGDKLVEMFQRVELGVTKRTVYDVDPAYFEKFMD